MRKCHYLDVKTSQTLGFLELLAPSWVSVAGFWPLPALDSPGSKGGNDRTTPLTPVLTPLTSLWTRQEKGFLPQKGI